jgi:hypothetical protein
MTLRSVEVRKADADDSATDRGPPGPSCTMLGISAPASFRTLWAVAARRTPQGVRLVE